MHDNISVAGMEHAVHIDLNIVCKLPDNVLYSKFWSPGGSCVGLTPCLQAAQ